METLACVCQLAAEIHVPEAGTVTTTDASTAMPPCSPDRPANHEPVVIVDVGEQAELSAQHVRRFQDGAPVFESRLLERDGNFHFLIIGLRRGRTFMRLFCADEGQVTVQIHVN